MSARFAIGAGARQGVDAKELAALVLRVASQLRVDLHDATLAALAGRDDAQGFCDAAALLNVKVVFLAPEMLRGRAEDVLTRSPRVEKLFGVSSLAEALALAAAGDRSILLAPRIATGRLTCAIARSFEGDASA